MVIQETNEARQKFSNAKAISSAQFFADPNNAKDTEGQISLQKLTRGEAGSQKISHRLCCDLQCTPNVDQKSRIVAKEKWYTFDQAPLVVFFHLKRFSTESNHTQKIDKFVEFPLELNNLSMEEHGKTK
ncbi:ADP-ribosylation factor GTPase-activating protein AGD10 [Acorus gramineus]|uniref:ADP-ribosylation factor GTPase-activating protein AGD10 n=1 Tax=Acorus gramineus TaxID=55184 RepID=A0AAV9BC59_ACOGR|nr:ADP-ribosylation factor GTPase-activating protein AGD10 [Acorus gramineus]